LEILLNQKLEKKIKEFWLSLSEDERNGLIKLEKEAVLKKMKEQQRYSCSCPVCGRRRIAIEKELEMLYDAYYEELERYAEKGVLAIEVKGGGVLSHVTDDLMKNEGKKFLDMMEKLAERRLRRQLEKEEHESLHISEEEDDDMTDEQRVEEGKRMFQMFAAKMFEQRVWTAFREKEALEKQKKLIEEEEERERVLQAKKENKQRKREAKKQKKKLQREKLEKEKKRTRRKKN